MKIVLIGYGKMGQMIAQLAKAKGYSIAGIIDHSQGLLNEEEKLKLLKNADVNLTDETGITALMYAVMFKNKNAVMLLLQKNADKTKTDAKGKTAFEYAVFSGQEEIINLLK